jgi:hypothetical protein
MADTTILVAPPRRVTPARTTTARAAPPRTARTLRLVRDWLTVAAVAVAASSGIAWANAADVELQGARTDQVVRNAALKSELHHQQLFESRAAILADDLRQRVSEQLAALESTEGFLK